MIRIFPSTLCGTLAIQPSKSDAHRAVLAAALSDGVSRIDHIAWSDDIRATAQACEALGIAKVEMQKDFCTVMPTRATGDPEVFCNESGSTLRFILPLAMDGKRRIFRGKGRLLLRPMTMYAELCRKQGILFEQTQEGITVQGVLRPDDFALRGDVSSQFVTGLLFALPRLAGDSHISFLTPLQSRAYVDMTIETLERFGVRVKQTDNGFEIPGNQTFRSCDVSVEGDYSHAAFFAVGAALSGDVTLTGLRADSKQGDRAIFSLLAQMGAAVEKTHRVRAQKLHGIDMDVSQVPDLVPALCVAACGAQGTSRIYNAARLRIKESDRLSAMTAELTKLGADIEEYPDQLIIHGTGSLHGGQVDSHGDHRIAMAMSIASCIADGEIVLSNEQVVSKSAPAFYEEFSELGGKIQ